jgi:type I restriction enzyme, R subunit
VSIDADTVEVIKSKQGGDGSKVINLVKSIEKAAAEATDDPFLVALSDRAQAVLDGYEERHATTSDALDDLLKEIQNDEDRKKAQAERGIDSTTYFVIRSLSDSGFDDAEETGREIAALFSRYPNWQRSERELRDLRQQVTFALLASEDDLDKVVRTVEAILSVVGRSSAR